LQNPRKSIHAPVIDYKLK